MGSDGLKLGRILVVDDQDANIRLLAKVLASGGYQNLITTADPLRAVGMFESEHPDMVLLDLHMPKLDGYSILEQLRERLRSEYLPVVVLTADTEREARQRALSLGASEFLTKPIDGTEVLIRVENLMRTRFLYLELEREKASLEVRVQDRTSALEEARRDLEESMETLRRTDGERKNLLSALVRAQEEERARIASDIHDDSIQVMTAVGMRLGMMRRDFEDAGKQTAIDEVEDLVRRSIGRLRRLLFELRPPTLDREGLGPTLRTSLDDSNFKEIRTRLNDAMSHEPPAETRVVAYRIAQEALANVRKHSKATELEVSLETHGDGILIRIKDDGLGFALEDVNESRPGHIGLTSMRERAEIAGGWFRVDSAPGGGTTVECWIPEIS